MKKLLALLLSAALSPVSALAAEVGESPIPQAPLAPVAMPISPTALPTAPAELALGTPLAIPQTISIPEAAKAAAAPVTAQAALTQTASALDGKADAQALTSRFDGAGKLAAGMGAASLVIAATPAAPILALTPALPAMYSAWRLAKTPAQTRWKSGHKSSWRDSVETTLTVGGAALASAFLITLAHAFIGGGPAFGVAAGLGALLIGNGGIDLVAHNRGEGIQRWQASHDQKYRVDPGTGQLKDVRGHKYGQLSDRFVEHVPGPVSGLETALLRLLGVGTALGVAALFSAPASTLLIINALAAAGFAISDLLPKRDYAPPQSAPDR